MSDHGGLPVEGPVRVEVLDDGALWRVVLATPKANIVDMAKSELLSGIFGRACESRDLRAVVLDSDGPHFSFGASVAEHLPPDCERMIRGFHALFGRILDAAVPTIAAVRGQCLGGGLELAAFCGRVIAAPGAMLGQPEIVLGVFAPVASVALAERVGRGRAEHLCLTGASIDARTALDWGLVDEVADEPTAAALGYARRHLLRHSASSLRFAERAVRAGFAERFRADLARVERLYLEELMRTSDAVEGLTAFVEKRDPTWSHS